MVAILYILFALFMATICTLASDFDVWSAIKSIVTSVSTCPPNIRTITSGGGTEHETIIKEGKQENAQRHNSTSGPVLKPEHQARPAVLSDTVSSRRKKKLTGAGDGGRTVKNTEGKILTRQAAVIENDDGWER